MKGGGPRCTWVSGLCNWPARVSDTGKSTWRCFWVVRGLAREGGRNKIYIYLLDMIDLSCLLCICEERSSCANEIGGQWEGLDCR